LALAGLHDLAEAFLPDAEIVPPGAAVDLLDRPVGDRGDDDCDAIEDRVHARLRAMRSARCAQTHSIAARIIAMTKATNSASVQNSIMPVMPARPTMKMKASARV